jgi:hypothetical protein
MSDTNQSDREWRMKNPVIHLLTDKCYGNNTITYIACNTVSFRGKKNASRNDWEVTCKLCIKTKSYVKEY